MSNVIEGPAGYQDRKKPTSQQTYDAHNVHEARGGANTETLQQHLPPPDAVVNELMIRRIMAVLTNLE